MWRRCVRAPPAFGRRLPLLRCASGSISTLAMTPNACRHRAPASSVFSAGAPGLRRPPTTTIEARRPFVSSRPATTAIDQQPNPIPLSTLLAGVPPPLPPSSSSLDAIRAHLKGKKQGKWRQKLVVVDDDPTGTQSVEGFPVLSEWTPEALMRELQDDATVGFFLLSNVRALPPDEAGDVLRRIRHNLGQALQTLHQPWDSVTVFSRSDSTLRGHFPLDVDILCGSGEEEGAGRVVTVVAPYFEAGGRLTINDVHYMTTPLRPGSSSHKGDDDGEDGVGLLPVHLTPFARDKAFGFRHSNLRDWVSDKVGGRVPPHEVASLSLDDIRRGGAEGVKRKLLGLLLEGGPSSQKTTYVVVNAVTRHDLEVAVHGCLLAETEAASGTGKGRFVYRTAADWVAVRAGLGPLPPLPAAFFREEEDKETTGGGLVVVGSYVPKSSEQLQHLREMGGIEAVELQVDRVIQSKQAQDAEAARVRGEVEALLKAGRDVAVYTTRALRQDDGKGGLLTGQAVSEALVDVVRMLNVRPRFLIAKGGITSNDVATKGLGVKRAMTLGPILPGVPVWATGPESKFPGMKYVVFPGNVGSPSALADAVSKLRGDSQTPAPAASSSAGKTQAHGGGKKGAGGGGGGGGGVQAAPAVAVRVGSGGRVSRTLDILGEAHSRGQAVGAFNVYNLEGVRAVVMAAKATGASALLQVHPSSLEYGGAPLLELCKAARLYLQQDGPPSSSSVPRIAVHLDHAHEAPAIEMALKLGVDSVMCDGSALPYEENVAWTAMMAAKAHALGVPVEAELGRLAGEEDGLSVAEKEAKMTDPAQVPDFVARTNVDLVAVTIGNVHGRYAVQPPQLDMPRLEAIRKATDRLLVLHGASGLSPSLVHETIRRGGVCKFNVNTEVREAAMRVVKGGKAKDVLPLMQATGSAMQAVIEQKMRLFRP